MLKLPTFPQTVSQIFGTSYQIFKSTFPKTISFLVLVFLLLIMSASTNQWLKQIQETQDTKQIIMAILLVLVEMFLFYAIFGAIIYRMHSITTQEDPGFSTSFLYGSKKVVPLIAVIILNSIIVMIGTFLLVIPGIIAFFYLIFSVYLLYMNFGIIESLRESASLVHHHWWQTFGRLILLWFVIFLAAIIIAILPGIVMITLESLFGPHLGLQGSASNILFTVIVGIAMLIFYMIVYVYHIAFMLACIYDLQILKSKELKKS